MFKNSLMYGNDLVYVSQISALKGQTNVFINSLRNTMEFHAYNFQSRLGVGTTGNAFKGQLRDLMTSSGEWFNTLSSMNFPWTFNNNFKYPF